MMHLPPLVLDVLAALMVPISNYLICALPAWWLEKRRGLPADVASWRSPLGIWTGLYLHLAHGVLGAAGGALAAWILVGDPGLLFDSEETGVGIESAALAGTVIGGLGGLATTGIAYRLRGAGWRAAGWLRFDVASAVMRAITVSVLFTIVALVYTRAFTMIFDRAPESAADPMVDYVREGGAGPVWLLLLVVTVVVVAPIMEEVIYRGVIYRAFRDRTGVEVGVLSSGLLFSLSHYQPDYVLPLWLFGGALAWLYERSGSLGPPILAHAVYNSVALYLDMASGGG
jgi:membrane protease YdiL (CAAX protease family)